MGADDAECWLGGELGGDVLGDEGAAADKVVAAGLGVPGVGFGVVGESGLVKEVGTCYIFRTAWILCYLICTY